MKVAVPARGTDLDAALDPRFGRAASFLLVEPDTGAFEVMANASPDVSGGAGVHTAQLLAQHGVGAVLASHVGPHALLALRAAGIEVYEPQGSTVREAVAAFASGRRMPLARGAVADHAGRGLRGQRGRGAGGSGRRPEAGE